MDLIKKGDELINPLRKMASCIGAPIFDLAARLYLAHVFFKSGLTRFKDFQSGNFDNQILLFEDEHPVPGLSPEFAAGATTIAELILPILLAFGLFGRVGAAGILIMTAVIELTYGHFADHILWAFLAATIFIKGPGLISVDHFLLQWLRKDQNNNGSQTKGSSNKSKKTQSAKAKGKTKAKAA